MPNRSTIAMMVLLALLFVGCSDEEPTKPDRWRVLGDVTSAETGRPIPKVEVTLGESVTESSSDGSYVFGDLKTGSYEITATADGYRTYDTILEVNQNLRHDIAMELRRPN